MRYELISSLSSEEFRRLTGIKRETFEKMLELLTEARTKKKAISTVNKG